MKDLIIKWWNRKWSNWEYQETIRIYGSAWDKAYGLPNSVYELYKSTSNDGLVKFKRINK